MEGRAGCAYAGGATGAHAEQGRAPSLCASRSKVAGASPRAPPASSRCNALPGVGPRCSTTHATLVQGLGSGPSRPSLLALAWLHRVTSRSSGGVVVCLQHPLSAVRLLRVAETPQHFGASLMNVLGLTVGHWVVRRRRGHTKTGQVCQCCVETADESALTITRNLCREPTAQTPFAVESASCCLGQPVVKHVALDPLAG